MMIILAHRRQGHIHWIAAGASAYGGQGGQGQMISPPPPDAMYGMGMNGATGNGNDYATSMAAANAVQSQFCLQCRCSGLKRLRGSSSTEVLPKSSVLFSTAADCHVPPAEAAPADGTAGRTITHGGPQTDAGSRGQLPSAAAVPQSIA
ncbi:homeobox protein extradenticle-like [Tropilaelaps mercedesae]|uniref:Homeobox protein extradenticle-like n=1 Tax=Tropilaelaps mercedesae TaxID=418985 RepID=A0A1V9XC29_9ACAR|nr:homeobox protein extradenticle-like [Tropilaelaps mercedesae]